MAVEFLDDLTAPAPERPDTIAAQMEALTAGRKRAVLVTPRPDGWFPHVPSGYATFHTPQGAFIFDPGATSTDEVRAAFTTNRVGELLGYGSAAKPDNGNAVLQTKTPAGVPIQEEVVTPATLPAAVAAGNAVSPRGPQQIKPAEQVLSERAAGVNSAGASQNGRASPAGGTGAGGVEWLDQIPAQGVEFLAEQAAPADAKEIARRFLNPDYQPTLAEFKVYDAARKARGVKERASDFLELAGNAVSGLWDTVVRAGKAVPAMIKDPESNNPLVTAAEGVARGTARDLELAKKLLPSEWGSKLTGGMNFDQFAAVKLGQLNEQKFRYTPLRDASQLMTRADMPPEVLANWRTEYDEQFKPQSAYEAFLGKRQTARDEIKRAQSRASVITGREAPISPDIAEAQSLVTSPMMLVPFGAAMTPAKTLTRAVAARTLEGAGKTFEWVGEKTVQAAKLPERAAGATARMITGSEDAAAKATEQVAAGVAGVSTLPIKAAGKTISATGEALQAAGRQAAEGPSRYGLFDRIRLDAKAPEWMRRAANAARPLDPAVSMAGTAAKGATEGAAIGATLGAIADGEEGAASGLGAGLALGAGGGILGRLAAGGRYRAGLEDLDVARWLASKSPDEIQNIRDMNLTRAQAIDFMDLQRLTSGVRSPGQSGDIEWRILSDKEFTKQAGGRAQGAQLIQGDRPLILINSGYKGPSSIFHETLHALEALEGFSEARQRLNRVLFDQTLTDGTLISKGLYSAAEVAEFGDQYRSRLFPDARTEWERVYRPQPGDSPEVLVQKRAAEQAKVMEEIRADAFRNMMAGRSGLAFPARFGSVRARVADSLLLATQMSFLARMRRGLANFGVKFDASGTPSELFVRNGRPITNTPAVDAALRDYLRAKDQISRRLTAGEDGESGPRVTPQDLVTTGNEHLVAHFKDFDLIAKNPDGSVKMLGGRPVLLSEREIRAVQSKRTDAILAALDAVPDLGAADAWRKQPNGAYEGRSLSDKQLAALLALPDDILPPGMKDNLKQLNDMARADGSQIILDYNAALKGGKYSSGIAPTVRAAVPLTFNISKAGNFFMVTLDTSHFFRKLGEWQKSRPRAFDAWGGDKDAFLRDVFTYLDNHRSGRAGSVNLDSDAAAAVNKKNVINAFFNVPQAEGVNPVKDLNRAGNRDNLIRSRRFDRINRVTPGAGDKFPVRYERLKANLLPANPQTETPEFKRWFGKSKVVDAEGRPLTIYRGEQSGSEHTVFERRKTRERGFFLTPDREIASIYSRWGEPRAFYVKADKLLDLTQDTIANRKWVEKWGESFESWIDRATGEIVDPFDVVQGGQLFDYEGDWSSGRWKDLQTTAEQAGYDAVILPDFDSQKGVFQSVVVFKPEHIKSATHNRGTFDPANPDIRFLPAGPVKETDNQLGWLNDVWAARYPNEAAWEVAAIQKLAPRGGVELVNPGFPNYKAFITRSPKDPSYPYQTTWFYDDAADVPIPVGDRATTTYEDAVKVALNAGFTHESLLDNQLRNRYASDYAKAFGGTETGGAQGLQAQAGSQSGTVETARPTARSGQAQPNPRTAQVKFLPAASPVAVQKHLRSQTVYELAGRVPGPPNLAPLLAEAYVAALDQRLNRSSPLTRTAQLQRVADVAGEATPQEMGTAMAVLTSEGWNGVKEHLARVAVMKAVVSVAGSR